MCKTCIYIGISSMIFAEPVLDDIDLRVLELIRKQRDRLKMLTQSYPRRWMGSLRRNTFARAIQGSNTIEGYHATIDEAVAVIEDEPPLDEKTETWFAINGYRDAMTYIIQAAEDNTFELSKQFLKSLHFMMVNHDLNSFPGRWRPGAVYVVNRDGETVYEPPPVEEVDQLILELVSYLQKDCSQSTLVTAAMAHLNLTMIHPFKDGNGRMARALQTLVLAREGHVHPLFSSIEEWLGRNTERYYSVLAAVGKGSWHPGNDALPWVRFCLTAHFQQANTVIRRFDEYDLLFERINQIIEKNGIHDRMALPMFDCAVGLRMTNARYQKDADVTQYVAGRDLKELTELGLFEPHGEKRGRFYTAGPDLQAARNSARKERTASDPYDLIDADQEAEPLLPGLEG